ncbi:MAG TPA: lipocalin family protein [Bacteroidales bacterium]|nr:lipocalin family protein [Bacteroidales bacterium]
MKLVILIAVTMMTGVQSPKPKMQVVTAVDLNRYKGTWYEIARLPNSFEKDLVCTSANYTLRPDGRITVVNKGRKKDKLSNEKSATGVAWIPDASAPTKLKVRFFWPFSGNYWILALDKDYKYALIGEPSCKYLWILCRERTIDDSTYNMLLETARENGYDTNPVIRVSQECN